MKKINTDHLLMSIFYTFATIVFTFGVFFSVYTREKENNYWYNQVKEVEATINRCDFQDAEGSSYHYLVEFYYEIDNDTYEEKRIVKGVSEFPYKVNEKIKIYVDGVEFKSFTPYKDELITFIIIISIALVITSLCLLYSVILLFTEKDVLKSNYVKRIDYEN